MTSWPNDIGRGAGPDTVPFEPPLAASACSELLDESHESGRRSVQMVAGMLLFAAVCLVSAAAAFVIWWR